MNYQNPIIPGFHPDPSICRVKDTYYLVTSSFEYFPCLPIFQSKDLINWEQIGYCITRNEQLTLKKGAPNGTGLYAPTIRYYNGTYYVVCTNVAHGEKSDGNFMIWSKTPKGPWSDPIPLDLPGIDPSLFFDEDGSCYYTGVSDCVYLCRIDALTGKKLGDRIPIWQGSGGNNPEGPHIYKRDGWYYQLLAEGGTEYCHMVTLARSRTILGPYESCPYNPVLTNRSKGTPIKAIGHADIVFDPMDHPFAVCLGIRPISYPFRHNLGRETMLVPMEWNEGEWPVFGNQGVVEERINTENLKECEQTIYKKSIKCYDFQTDPLSLDWNCIYNEDRTLWEKNEKGLSLKGNKESLSSADRIAWIGRRQEHHECIAKMTMQFPCKQEGEEAGVTIYLNNRHHYEVGLSVIEGQRVIVFKRQIGSLKATERVLPYEREEVTFEVVCNKENYVFYYYEGDRRIYVGSGESSYLTTEVGGVFTGNYIAMYAVGNGVPCRTDAIVTNFSYEIV